MSCTSPAGKPWRMQHPPPHGACHPGPQRSGSCPGCLCIQKEFTFQLKDLRYPKTEDEHKEWHLPW